MMIRIKTVLMAAISAWLLSGCTKEQVFSNPNTGTIRELGFEWNENYTACLDSDDLESLQCGTALWLDGERVVLDLPAPEAVVSAADGKLQKKSLGVQTILYRYIPVSQSVIFYLEEGEMTLQWKEGGFCFEGDVLDGDFLTICRGTSAS